ncbi:type II secretion system protein GspL [Sphaerotilus sp.]|uniref:type II secretion system protein GspL n=1 Tax=Sphaerotilus sp. TaxID=2093942 RepID=UPI0034E29248
MSLLVIQLPTRTRLHPQSRASAPGAGVRAELGFVLSPDGQSIQSEGQCAASLLPKATAVVAVLAPADVAFHRLTCPKAPAARLRAALAGILEEQVLDEVDQLHLGLAPDARPGDEAWVAAIDRGWLTAELAALETAGVVVDRVVPGLWPDAQAHGHFHVPYDDDKPKTLLTWADAQGVSTWPLQGSLSRGLLPEPLADNTLWTADPAAAAPAERWLGQPVQVLGMGARLLASAQSGWNLRQFELAARHRGLALLRDAGKQFLTPGWRPVRLGLIGLLLANLAGLNAWAWMQRNELQVRRTAVTNLLRTTHPQVRAVLDAPLQMARENEQLRASAGRPGDTDLEPLLQAAASVWPEGRPPQVIHYENGRLSLGAPGLGATEVSRMKATLEPAGWLIEHTDNQITLSRPTTPGAIR